MSAGRSAGNPSNPQVGGLSPLVASFQQWAYGGGQALSLPRPAGQFETGAFGPSTPIIPMPIDAPLPDGLEMPRRTQYPVAWNLPVGEPGSEGLGKLAPFNVLRAVADKYSVVRSCIRLRVQEIIGLDWDIVPTREKAEAMKGSDTVRTDFEKRKADMMRFWEKPDRSPESPYDNWEDWMVALMEDALVTDAVALYPHPALGGQGKGWFNSGIASLDLIDGTTIRPLYSMHGGRPSPSAVAWQQYLWGVPRSDFATMAEGRDTDLLPDFVDQFERQELMYIRTWPRTWAPYGFSAVEQVLLPIAIGYARQTQQLEFYSEGSVPYLFIVPGNDLIQSPQQIRQLQNALNNVAGDTGWKQKIVVLPPNSKPEPIKPYDQASEFDYLIASYVAMSFGLTPIDLGLIPAMGSGSNAFGTGSARMAEQGQANAKDRWLEPFVNYWGRWFNYVIQVIFGQEDMEWHWTGLEQGTDADELIDQQTKLFAGSLISVDEGRSEIGLDPFGADWSQVPWVVSGMGGMTPMPIAYEMAMNPPVPMGVDGEGKPMPTQLPRDQALAGTSGPAGKPVEPAEGRDERDQPTTPSHEAHRQLQSRPPAGQGAPANPGRKAQLDELDKLGRLLRKGRALDSFQPVHLTSDVLEVIARFLPDGIDEAIMFGGLQIIHKDGVPKGEARWARALQDRDLAVADKHEPQVLYALRTSVSDIEHAMAGALEAAGILGKVINGPQNAVKQIVEQVLNSLLRIWPDRLIETLRRIYRDAWAEGEQMAGEMVPSEGSSTEHGGTVPDQGPDGVTLGGVGSTTPQEPSDLRRLLAEANIVIQGVDTTTVDRIGNIVTRGIGRGSPIRTIAGEIAQILTSPARARMIARTEVSRAMAAATFHTYRQAGVQQWDWLDQEGACPVCVENAHNSPYPLGGGPPLPQHPNCRCCAAPVIQARRRL